MTEQKMDSKVESSNCQKSWTKDNESGICCGCWNNKSCWERSYLCLILILLCSVIALGNLLASYITNEKVHKENLCVTAECVRAASSILDRIDPQKSPCDVFYEFACGNYIRTRTVPDDHYNRNFLQEMQDEVYIEMKQYLETVTFENETDTAISKVKLFYASCMNETSSNDEDKAVAALLGLFPSIGGAWPLLEYIKSGRIENSYNLEERLASLFMYQVQPFFHLYVAPPEKNLSYYALHLFGGSTVLESSYFANVSQSIESQQPIQAYMELQMNVLRLFSEFLNIEEENLNMNQIHDEILEVVQFEADLANLTRDSSMDNFTGESETAPETETNTDEFSDDASTNNSSFVTKISDLEKEYPGMNWVSLFSIITSSAGVNNDEIFVYNKEYLQELVRVVQKHSRRTVDNYLWWTVIARFMPYLGPKFRRLYADFRRQVPDVSSSESDPSATRVFLSRWKECVHLSAEGLDIPATTLYLKKKKYFLNNIYEELSKMIKDIRETFKKIISKQKWVDDETKTKIYKRIDDIGNKIGFPKFLDNDTLIDGMYSDMDIDESEVFLSNIIKMARHEVLLEVKKLNKIVDPDKEWVIQPLIVNAFYETATNSILLPAGILRFPLLSLNRPKYLDFASLGAIIGHEIGHAFDSNSRKLMGTNCSWWPDSVMHEYEEKAKCFAQQFTNFDVEPLGEHLNGNLTLEENICDFAGLQQSFHTFRRLGVDLETTLPGLHEYNSNQLFFIKYAHLYCEVASIEGQRRALLDNHSPGRFRTNGILSNTPEFTDAFNCPSGSKMNPVEKCTLW